jgi:hypothetical protein
VRRDWGRCKSRKVLEECNTAADFPQIVMDEIVRVQGVRRWAEKSPESLLHLPLVKQLIPGLWSFISSAMGAPLPCLWRNYVMSALSRGWTAPKPDGSRCVLGMEGRARAKLWGLLGPDRIEFHFEDLIASPQETLNKDRHLNRSRTRLQAHSPGCVRLGCQAQYIVRNGRCELGVRPC